MMPLDPVTERVLKDVHPGLAERIRKLAELLHPEGLQFRAYMGLRSNSQQLELWRLGRETPSHIPCKHGAVGTCAKHPFGVPVTNARPGESWHNYGCAVDVAPDNPALPGYQPNWNAGHPAWKRLIEVAESLGLRSGKSWQDSPHLEFTGRFGTKPDGEIEYLYKEGGLKAVWEAIT